MHSPLLLVSVNQKEWYLRRKVRVEPDRAIVYGEGYLVRNVVLYRRPQRKASILNRSPGNSTGNGWAWGWGGSSLGAASTIPQPPSCVKTT